MVDLQIKPKILIFTEWFYPAFKAGGPIKSVHNIINYLKEFIEFSIVTSDRDLGDNEALDSILTNQWIKRDGYEIIYLDKSLQTVSFYRKLFNKKKFDGIYLNSMFSLNFSIKPVIATFKLEPRIILAPRGMLGDGALKIKAPKKKIYLFILSKLKALKGVIWHATAEEEMQDIQNVFGENAIIIIAPNYSGLLSNSKIYKKKSVNELNMFFLSRVSPKKNLIFALNCLKGIDSKYKINYKIIGPKEDSHYWQECEKIIEQLPKNINVYSVGAVPPTNLIEEIKDQHLLFLPTSGENHGHVILESLSASCPVLISNLTPFKNLKEIGIGWDIDLCNDEEYIEAIQYCASLNEEQFNEIVTSAYQYASNQASLKRFTSQTLKLFKS